MLRGFSASGNTRPLCSRSSELQRHCLLETPMLAQRPWAPETLHLNRHLITADGHPGADALRLRSVELQSRCVHWRNMFWWRGTELLKHSAHVFSINVCLLQILIEAKWLRDPEAFYINKHLLMEMSISPWGLIGKFAIDLWLVSFGNLSCRTQSAVVQTCYWFSDDVAKISMPPPANPYSYFHASGTQCYCSRMGLPNTQPLIEIQCFWGSGLLLQNSSSAISKSLLKFYASGTLELKVPNPEWPSPTSFWNSGLLLQNGHIQWACPYLNSTFLELRAPAPEWASSKHMLIEIQCFWSSGIRLWSGCLQWANRYWNAMLLELSGALQESLGSWWLCGIFPGALYDSLVLSRVMFA